MNRQRSTHLVQIELDPLLAAARVAWAYAKPNRFLYGKIRRGLAYGWIVQGNHCTATIVEVPWH